MVVERLGLVQLQQPFKPASEQTHLINLLKPWIEPAPILTTQLTPSVDIGSGLTLCQWQDLLELDQFWDMFSETLGQTHFICHDIKSPPGATVSQQNFLGPRGLPYTMAESSHHAHGIILWDGIIEEMHSPWFSPILVVPKHNSSLQLCNNFWKLNTISKLEIYPLLQVDNLVDQKDDPVERLGKA